MARTEPIDSCQLKKCPMDTRTFFFKKKFTLYLGFDSCQLKKCPMDTG
jgi:hypothetical protein